MNLSLLIHTFNGYQHIWPGCLQSWAKISIPVPKYFGTDIEFAEKHDFGDFNLLYSGHGSWSDRLIRLLSKIPTDYILYMQEDHWPISNPPDLSELMHIMTEKQLLRLQISQDTRYYTLNRDVIPYIFDQKSKYLVSHQPTIWLKSFLLDQIRYNETPWINEYEGTKRLNSEPEYAGKIALYESNWYIHTCVRGKLIQTQ
jgi:hypothetical protein